MNNILDLYNFWKYKLITHNVHYFDMPLDKTIPEQ